MWNKEFTVHTTAWVQVLGQLSWWKTENKGCVSPLSATPFTMKQKWWQEQQNVLIFRVRRKKSFPNLIKKLNVQFPLARILFLIFIYIVSFFQESQNNGAPQILKKKKKSCHNEGGDRLGRAGAQRGQAGWEQALGAGSTQAEGGSEAALPLPAAHGPCFYLHLPALQDKDLPLVSLTSFKSNYFDLNSNFSSKNPREGGNKPKTLAGPK